MQKRFLQFSGLSGAMAVALGAIGAHYLKTKVETGQITFENLQTYETAVRYQMFHSIVILAIVLGGDRIDAKLLRFSCYFFIIGIILFSGSLYLLSIRTLLGIESWHWLGPITPLGGLFFILGWVFVFIAALKLKK